jgi:hypothetical protein
MTTNRFSLIVALSVIAALAVLTISMMTAPRTASSTSSYDQIELLRAQRYHAAAAQQYDQIDLMRAERYKAAALQQAYQAFRHGEQTTGVNSALADLNYRRGEWAGK